MTDNEIVKALEFCSEAESCIWCKYEPPEHQKVTVGCCYGLMKSTIDLIKQQRAEIERYKGVIKLLEKDVSTAKSDGIKEFLEKLIQETRTFSEYDEGGWECDVSAISAENIDRIAKEMMEDINDT